MNDLEGRLRTALRAEALGVDPDEHVALEAVRRRGHAARQRRRVAVGGAALAVVVAAAVAVVPPLGRSAERVETPAGEVTTTVPAPGPTPTSAPGPAPTVAPTDLDAALYPRPHDSLLSDDPVAVARGFVEAYFGSAGGAVGAAQRFSAFRELEFGPGGFPAGEVDVFRVGESGQVLTHVVSTISLVALDGDHFFVVGASSDDLHLDSPGTGATVASPLAVEGRGRGYEGTVVVEVRDRIAPSTSLGREVTIAGCCESLEPFAVDVEFAAFSSPLGALVVHNDSGISALDSFTVRPVRFGGASTATTSFQVFFHRGDGPLVAVNRTVPRTPGVLRAALSALLAGPTEEERQDGLTSLFSAASASMLVDVRIDDGVATVDFDDRLADALPNASASAASMALLAELDATVFQFASVRSARYRLEGDCGAFATWLQLDSCERGRP